MKSRQQSYGTIAVACMTLIGCMAQCDRSMAEPQPVATLAATVQTLEGSLEVQRTGATESQSLSARAPLFGGDVTNTGLNSKATFLFNEGSRLDINSNSIVELTKPERVAGGRQSLFRLVRGEVFMRARSALAVQTRSATAAVRGTAFQLTSDVQGTSVLTVHEGSVDFFNPYGAVVVNASQQSTARFGFAPTTPVPVAIGIHNISWTRDLDQALLSGSVKGTVTSSVTRKKSFWNKGWVRNILLPAVVIGGIAAIVDDDDGPDPLRDNSS
jgi:hypothetical protein